MDLSKTHLDVNEWMAKASDVVKQVEELVANNLPDIMTQSTMDPQYNEAVASDVAKLGFRNARHFCESFPDKFQINAQTGVIALQKHHPLNRRNRLFEATRVELPPPPPLPLNLPHIPLLPPVPPVPLPILDPASFLLNYKPTPPSQATPIVKPTQSNQKTKMADKLHFKITHQGETRRFAVSASEDDLLSALKIRVLKITGTEDVTLFWKDEDSLILLENEDDMQAAIDFAQTQGAIQNKLPCINLETKGVEKDQKEKVKTEEKTKEELQKESIEAFNGFAFVCDECDCFLAPSNGGRYKCTVCDNYDLCAACVAKNVHFNHALVRLFNADTSLPIANVTAGQISMKLKDQPRCTPTFIVKGTNLKGMDNVVIDVIDNLGRHVGRKMYETADWLKKEAEKMQQRKEEAEVEEQKMMEELIRRENQRVEAEKKRKAHHREEVQKKNMEKMNDEMEKVKIEEDQQSTREQREQQFADAIRMSEIQIEKDRRLAMELMQQAKMEKHRAKKEYKMAAKQLKNDWRQKKREHNEKIGGGRFKRLHSGNNDEAAAEAYLASLGYPLEEAEKMQEDVSETSDVEIVDKPEEQNDVVSDLVVLDSEPVQQQQQPAQQENKQSQSFPTELKKPLFVPKAPLPPALVDDTPRMYPVLPDEEMRDERRREGRREIHEERRGGRADRYEGIRLCEEDLDNDRDYWDGWGAHLDDSAFGRGSTGYGQSNWRYASDLGYDRRGHGRRWGFNPRQFHTANDLDRQARQSRSEREDRWRREHDRSAEVSCDFELLVPVHMELSVLQELESIPRHEDRMHKLAQYTFHLGNNLNRRAEHPSVFARYKDDFKEGMNEEEKINKIALDLSRRLRNMEEIIAHSRNTGMIRNRIYELQSEISLKSNRGPPVPKHVAVAQSLKRILLTGQYTIPSGPLANFGRGMNIVYDQARGLANQAMSYYGSGPSTPRGAHVPSVPSAPSTPSAPAVEKENKLEGEQKKLYGELLETGMFEDMDKMVQVCRKATDIHEAIDMMLQ